MQTYRVNKYFQWGSLDLEPFQSLIVNDSAVPECFDISIEGKSGSIKVSHKAFALQEKRGSISVQE